MMAIATAQNSFPQENIQKVVSGDVSLIRVALLTSNCKNNNNNNISRLNFTTKVQNQAQKEDQNYNKPSVYSSNNNNNNWKSSINNLLEVNRKSVIASHPPTPPITLGIENNINRSRTTSSSLEHKNLNLKSIRLHRNRVLIERVNNAARTSSLSSTLEKKSPQISSSSVINKTTTTTTSTITKKNNSQLKNKNNSCILESQQQKSLINFSNSKLNKKSLQSQVAPIAAVTNSRLRQGALYARRNQYHHNLTTTFNDNNSNNNNNNKPQLSNSKSRFSATSLTSLNSTRLSTAQSNRINNKITTLTTSPLTNKNNTTSSLLGGRGVKPTTNNINTTNRIRNSTSSLLLSTSSSSSVKATASHARAKNSIELYNRNSSNNNRIKESYLNANRSIANNLFDRRASSSSSPSSSSSTLSTSELESGNELNCQSLTQLINCNRKIVIATATATATATTPPTKTSSSGLEQKLTDEKKSSSRKIGNRKFSLASSTSSLSSLAVVKKVKPSPTSPQQQQSNSNLLFLDQKGGEISTNDRIKNSKRIQSNSRRSSISGSDSCSNFGSSSSNSPTSPTLNCGSGNKLVLFNSSANNKRNENESLNIEDENCCFLHDNNSSSSSGNCENKNPSKIVGAKYCEEEKELLLLLDTTNKCKEKVQFVESAIKTRSNSNDTNNVAKAPVATTTQPSATVHIGDVNRIEIIEEGTNKNSVASSPKNNEPKVNEIFINEIKNNCQMMDLTSNIIETNSNILKQRAFIHDDSENNSIINIVNINNNNNKDDEKNLSFALTSIQNNNNNIMISSSDNDNNNQLLLAINSQRGPEQKEENSKGIDEKQQRQQKILNIITSKENKIEKENEYNAEEKDNDNNNKEEENYFEEPASQIKQQNKKQKKDPIDIPIRIDSINDYYDLDVRPFARGKFAQVKRCVNKITKQCFAAKCIKKRRRLVDIRHEILLEIEALKLSYYTNKIIRLYEVFETTNEIILILELAKGGELQRVIDDEELINEKLVKKMIKQILEGLIELHDNDIAHLDLKPQNLLLTDSFPNGDIKLCDFGLSRRITKDCEIREICGTPDYVAPEILRYDPISLATDMWSLGVLTYVLLSGYSPFGSENKQQTFCNITQATLDFPSDIFDNNKISKDAIDFMKKLIVREPAERLTSRQARNHLWLINE